MSSVRPLVLLSLLATVGCASNLDEVRKLAARRFECPEAETVVHEVGSTAFTAEGCGQRLRLDCHEEGERGLVCPKDAPIEGKDPNAVTVAKSDPPSGCKEMGAIQTGSHGSYEALYGEFKAQVRKRGGNYGRLDGQSETVLRGVAYACPR
jgi:hypothetical protein